MVVAQKNEPVTGYFYDGIPAPRVMVNIVFRTYRTIGVPVWKYYRSHRIVG